MLYKDAAISSIKGLKKNNVTILAPGFVLNMTVLLLSIFLFCAGDVNAEKLYVVEKESGSLSVIENGAHKGEIKGLGNLNHATVKFHKGSAYVISRDGYISRIDVSSDKIIKKVKVGNSGIDFTFVNGLVAVANYDPGDVVVLDEELNIRWKIQTGSRNVGVKGVGRLLIFSLMDRDEIWVFDTRKDLEIVKIVKDAGAMPFDGLLTGDIYVAGFFNEGSLGILDLKDMTYKKKKLIPGGSEVVFKIPHFGTWGIWNNMAFVPAVGERAIHIIGFKNFKYLRDIDLIGLPVFVSVSPDRKYITVNYSGDKEDFITVVDPEKKRVLADIKAGKRITHIRFSKDGKKLYASSYFENKMKIIDVGSWEVAGEIVVPTPSGIFIAP